MKNFVFAIQIFTIIVLFYGVILGLAMLPELLIPLFIIAVLLAFVVPAPARNN